MAYDRYQICWIFGISVGITSCVGKNSSYGLTKRARTKKAFFLRFIFAVDQQLACTSEFICPPEHAGRVHTGGARAGDARAEAFVSC